MENTVQTPEALETLRQRLARALCEAAEGLLPADAGFAREEFYPMREIKSRQELLWTLDYAAEKYAAPGESREGYFLDVYDYTECHPVFLIATVYVLLKAGAEVHVSYGEDLRLLNNRILDRLSAMGMVSRFLPRDPYSDEETGKYIRKRRLTNLVCLGDAPNSHTKIRLARENGVRRLFYPANHLLIADFEAEPVWTEKNRLFADQCWEGSVDYEAYRAPTNEAEDVHLGFDFGDLFWGADAVVNERNRNAVIADKIPAIIFTDRPEDRVWLPGGIENCCDAVLFRDYDCRFPRYDFLQLV